MRRTYVWRNGQFVDKKTGEPAANKTDTICMPYVRGDIAPYTSPVTGEVIDGRAARRYDLEKHNCYEVDPPKNKYLKNERFAKKHKVEHWLG